MNDEEMAVYADQLQDFEGGDYPFFVDPMTEEDIGRNDSRPFETSKRTENVKMYNSTLPGSIPVPAHLTVINIVTCARTNTKIDVERFVSMYQHLGFRYTANKFPSAGLGMRNPKCTVFLFSTGVIHTTGSRSLESAHDATYFVLDLLHAFCESGQVYPYKHARILGVNVSNMVGTTFVPFSVNLKKLTANRHVTLDRARFCGACVDLSGLSPKFSGSKAKVLVFQSGALIITGTRTTSDMKLAHDEVFPLLAKSILDVGLGVENSVPRTHIRRAQESYRLANVRNDASIVPLNMVENEERLSELHDGGGLDLVTTSARNTSIQTRTGATAPLDVGEMTVTDRNVIAINSFATARVNEQRELVRRDECRANPPKKVRMISMEEVSGLFMEE